ASLAPTRGPPTRTGAPARRRGRASSPPRPPERPDQEGDSEHRRQLERGLATDGARAGPATGHLMRLPPSRLAIWRPLSAGLAGRAIAGVVAGGRAGVRHRIARMRVPAAALRRRITLHAFFAVAPRAGPAAHRAGLRAGVGGRVAGAAGAVGVSEA